MSGDHGQQFTVHSPQSTLPRLYPPQAVTSPIHPSGAQDRKHQGVVRWSFNSALSSEVLFTGPTWKSLLTHMRTHDDPAIVSKRSRGRRYGRDAIAKARILALDFVDCPARSDTARVSADLKATASAADPDFR